MHLDRSKRAAARIQGLVRAARRRAVLDLIGGVSYAAGTTAVALVVFVIRRGL